MPTPTATSQPPRPPAAAKTALAAAAAPWLRPLLRGAAWPGLREFAWERLVAPHFWWREFDFTAKIRGGMTVTDNTRDPIQKYLCFFGVWEPNLTAWIARRLQPGDVFVDVGANAGYFSLLAAALVGAQGGVVAVEAAAATFARLRRNLERNRAGNVRAVNVAVSDREEELVLYNPPGHDSGRATAVQSWAGGQGFAPAGRVSALPLAAILEPREWAAARLIKIDVEGFEGPVLASLLPLLPTSRPDLEIVAEVTPQALLATGQTPQGLLAGFAAAGFQAFEIENDYDPKSYLKVGEPPRPRRLASATFAEQRDLIFSRSHAESL